MNSKGLAFQRRATTGGLTTSSAGVLAGAPYFVRLDRGGTTTATCDSVAITDLTEG